jgi:hypothetical protein
MHLLTVRAANESGTTQTTTAPVPIVGEVTRGLAWPLDGEPVQASSTVWVQDGIGQYSFISLRNNAVSQNPSVNYDDTGMISFRLDSGGPISPGAWDIVDDTTQEVLGTINVSTSGAVYVGARYDSFSGFTGATDYQCIIDDEERPCDDVSSVSPGIHRLQVFGVDSDGNASPVPTNLFLRTSSPTNAVLFPVDGTSGGPSPTAVFTLEPNGFFEIAIDGNPQNAFPGSLGLVVVSSAELNLSAGVHTFAVRDFDGNLLASSSYTVNSDQGDNSNFAFPTYSDVFDVTSVSLNTTTRHPATGLDVNDMAAIQMRVRVPANARGVALDSMFVSVEWPDYLCSNFNDKMDIYLVSDVTGRQPSNIALDPNGASITVNNGYFELPSAWTSDLSSVPYAKATSGFEGFCGFPADELMCQLPAYCAGPTNELEYLGSGTGWLVAQGPVRAGETIDLLAVVGDAGDSALDSLMLLSGLRWLPEPPPPGILKPEEMPQQP